MHPEQAIAALRFDPLLPVWIIAVLGVIAALVVGLAAWRRARGTLLRLAAFAVLLAWLAGPRLVQETRQGLPDIGLLVVDHSDSMQIGDRARLADAARDAIAGAGGEVARPRAAYRHRAGERRQSARGCSPRSTAPWPTFPAPAWPARSRSPTDRSTTCRDTPPGGAPLNVLIPAKGEETDRRLRVMEAPSYGIVGKSVTLTGGHRGSRRIASDRFGRPDHPPRRRAAAGRQRADRPRTAHRACRSRDPVPPWWSCPPIRCRVRSPR